MVLKLSELVNVNMVLMHYARRGHLDDIPEHIAMFIIHGSTIERVAYVYHLLSPFLKSLVHTHPDLQNIPSIVNIHNAIDLPDYQLLHLWLVSGRVEVTSILSTALKFHKHGLIHWILRTWGYKVDSEYIDWALSIVVNKLTRRMLHRVQRQKQLNNDKLRMCLTYG